MTKKITIAPGSYTVPRKIVMPAIAFDGALGAILSAVQPLPAENVALAETLGRVAANAVLADEDAVPFPRSAMDGYAVRANDCALATQDNPIDLPVAGQVFAEQGDSNLPFGAALAITTGAPLPFGADSVIPHGATGSHGENFRTGRPGRFRVSSWRGLSPR